MQRKELNFYIKNVADTKMTAEEAAKEAELNGYKNSLKQRWMMTSIQQMPFPQSMSWCVSQYRNQGRRIKEFAEKIQDMLDHLCGVLGVAEVAEEEVSDEDVAKIEALIAEELKQKRGEGISQRRMPSEMSWQRWALPLRIPVRAYSGSEAKL